MNTGRALIEVYEGKLIPCIGEEEVEFCMRKAMKNPMENDVCLRVDVIEECLREEKECEIKGDSVNEKEHSRDIELEFEKPRPGLLVRMDAPIPSSFVRPPIVELKPLPTHLRYTFLGEENTSPLIISNNLTERQERKEIERVRKKTSVTGKEHFHLPFVDQMIERVAGHSYD